MQAETIAAALGGKRTSSGWICKCPSHDDSSPSLSLSSTPDGKMLVKCHAGCDQNNVLSALKSRNLWPKPSDSKIPLRKHEYLYFDIQGNQTQWRRRRQFLFDQSIGRKIH